MTSVLKEGSRPETLLPLHPTSPVTDYTQQRPVLLSTPAHDMSFKDGVDTTYRNKNRARGGAGDFDLKSLKGDRSAAVQEYYLGRSEVCEEIWYKEGGPKRVETSSEDKAEILRQEENVRRRMLGLQPIPKVTCFALLCFALLCFALLCFALLCFVVVVVVVEVLCLLRLETHHPHPFFPTQRERPADFDDEAEGRRVRPRLDKEAVKKQKKEEKKARKKEKKREKKEKKKDKKDKRRAKRARADSVSSSNSRSSSASSSR